MIKKISTLLLAIFLLASCSSDDAAIPEVDDTVVEPVKPDPVTPDPVTPVITPNPAITLPKGYVFDLLSNGVKFTSSSSQYLIDGEKLVSCGNGTGLLQKFTYAGDVITKIEDYANTTVARTYSFTYENNKLKTCLIDITLFKEFTYSYKHTYTHNADGTVSYVTELVSGKWDGPSKDGKGTLTITNGNIVRDDFFPTIENADFYKKESYIYEYDDKNNWCKNIKGLNLLYFLQDSPTYGNQCAANNIIKKSELEEIFNTNGEIRTPSRVVYTTDYGYEYNAENYPVKVTNLTDLDFEPVTGPTFFTY